MRGPPAAYQVSFSVYERDYLAPIQQAYQKASKALLDLLIREHGLALHFTTLKRYFFHEMGDVVLQFIDVAEEASARYWPVGVCGDAAES